MMYVILLSGVSLFGLLLLVLGVRGKRIDDHPLCRKCKYDLVGTAQLPTKCPECGSELSKNRATRIGNRKRKRVVLAIGLIIFTTSLTMTGLFGWAQAKNFDWYPFKPLWLLSNEAMHTVPRSQVNKPQREIHRRLADDKLSDRQIDGLVEKALKLQADQSIKWDLFWGDIIEDAWLKGKVSEDKFQKYLTTATSTGMYLYTRPKIKQGESVYIRYGYGKGVRAGSALRFLIARDYGPLRIDDDEIPSSFRSRYGEFDGRGSNHRSGTRYEVDAILGKHEITLQFHFNVAPIHVVNRETLINMNDEYRMTFFEKNKIHEWYDSSSITIEVVAQETPVIEIINAPELKDTIRKAITVSKCVLKKKNWYYQPDMLVKVDDIPVPVAFEVYWRVGEKEWLVNNLSATKSPTIVTSHNRPIQTNDFPLDATHVDVIFRSSTAVAEKRIGFERIWQGEIVFPNQPLEIIENKK